MPTSTPEKGRRSRITAACAVCRAKRQKCSGEKPTCDQCRLHNEECWWSDQKKRGPAKDYLRSLQDRLQETERLLLSLLPQVSNEQLVATLHNDTGHGPSHQAWATSLSGPEYWSKHPLNRPDTIREWQRHRTDGFVKSDHPGPHLPYPSQKLEQTPELPHMPHASPPILNGQAAPIARMIVDDPRQYQAVSQHPYGENGDWRQAQHGSSALSQRRYSEETRDACEALFSISNPARSVSKQIDPQITEMRPPTRQEETPTSEKQLPAQFPKHLFW
ncbi:unnamed protein product [Zymoseptoria tritici ST99CH_3D1]|uniref:Zn(2)-C6 fungal-type domain-containing protein n=1 Tax=Zymoseptoria tritici (strain ST99CH_3D7) TaxID=1276538 RepID=A0A1X7RW69_ZYMT9|nr:unnamed protein product [Zymoseptoria tritici ST99CH_3D7]SMR56128.1 unnamed protein product [Zymoseptoria tritici ST99CH_3D1]